MELATIFGKVSVRTGQITEIGIIDAGKTTPKPNSDLISFGGLQWHPWRAEFAIVDGRLASQPKARKGFRYGHWGNGRNPLLATHVGDKAWTNYRVDFDFAMLPKDSRFDPHRMPIRAGARVR